MKYLDEYFKERTLRKWMRQVVEALMYAHSLGVVHKDIKPTNFLLFGNANDIDSTCVKLTDFGGGQAFLDNMLAPDQQQGFSDSVTPLTISPGYMA